MNRFHAPIASAIASSFVLMACASSQPATQTKAASRYTDPQVAAIVVAANAADADLGEFAATRAQNPAVKEFARTMVRDHRAVNAQAGALVAKLGVTPQENDLSSALKQGGIDTRAKLSASTGTEFDKAYIAHEVAYHKAVIEAVDKVLLPSASNAELKGAITNVRPALIAHLAHAEHLQASIK